MSVFKNYAYYYDLLYQDKDYQAEYEYVSSLLNLHALSPTQVIELGCGSGSHACYFARDNINLYGVDISRQMLELANDKKSKLNKNATQKLNFHHGDVRSIRLNRKVDLVLSLFHVASYQSSDEDVLAYFRTAREHCREQGLFIFDFWYGPAVLKRPPYDREKSVDAGDCSLLRSTQARLDEDNHLVELNINLEIKEKASSKTESVHEEHVMRYFFREEINTLLSNMGLELVNLYGWMKQSSPTDDDWYAIAVARVSR